MFAIDLVCAHQNAQILQCPVLQDFQILYWACSCKVFKCAAMMLNIFNLASLELYFKHIEKLVIQYPQCWSLIYTAGQPSTAAPQSAPIRD